MNAEIQILSLTLSGLGLELSNWRDLDFVCNWFMSVCPITYYLLTDFPDNCGVSVSLK